MDFTITNNNGLSYQGKIVYGTDKEIITSTIVVTMPKIVINNSKTFNIKTATQLKAHVVLKNALVAVVEKVYEIRNGQTGNIWDALFSTSIIEPNKKFYKRFFGEILFKGTGDLFQEINAVAKNGGYTVNPTAGFIIEQFKSGNARRFFAANDRPSACRFMFMLKNGMPNQINQSAFGGYYSENQTVLFKRPTVGGNRRTKKRRVTKRKGYQRRNKTKSKKRI